MSITALNLIPLRPGVAPEEFVRFSQETDQPLLRSLPVVERFDVFQVGELVGDHAPQFTIVELLSVKSWQEWAQVRDADGDARLVAAGRRFAELADPAAVTAVLLDDVNID